MKHNFSERYTVEAIRGERVTRTRCAWCGMGSSWPGASEPWLAKQLADADAMERGE